MPSLSVINAAVTKLPDGPPLVVALAGGTTGIGSYIAETLAANFAERGSKLRVYIIGRNATRGEAVIAKGKELSPGSEWHLIQASDLALISEVDRSCAEIIQQESETPFHGGPARIDLLYMSYAYPILKERTTTKEGLDTFISTVYYSRIRFVLQLVPLLTASPLPGHAISIYAGGFEDGTSLGELPIGCPPPATYGVSGVRKHSCFMKTFVFEELAEKYAGRLRLSHIYPGLVDGPVFYSLDMPMWFRVLWRVIKPLAYLYMTSAQDVGQVMLYLATSRYSAKGNVEDINRTISDRADVAKSTRGEIGGGSYALGHRGDVQNRGLSYEKVRKDDTSKLVWEHTMETLDGIEKRNNERL